VQERGRNMSNLSLAGLTFLLLALPLLSACAPQTTEGQPAATQPPARMGLAEAREIAAKSECAQAGPLKEGGTYDESTGTWKIELEAEEEGRCAACIVHAPTGKVEVNWQCTPTPPEPVAPSEGLVSSEKQRDTSPDVAPSDLAALVQGNSAFAFDLYQKLKDREGSLFYSPHSISLALAMTYAGARGETERQMADTLHFTLPQERLHPAFNGLSWELARRGEGARGKEGKGFRLNIVNAIWGQEGYRFLPGFLDTLAENYGAGLRVLDFAGAPEEARRTINDRVSEETEGRIKDLIPQGVINALTRLILTNAIYFNAAWLHPFDEQQTKEGPFHLLEGGEVTVPMMRQVETFPYTEDEGYQAVELPYDGEELSMVILLPAEGQFGPFEDALSAERAAAILEGLERKRVALTMPKFTFESGFNLKQTLAAMGMPAAFSSGADFSGMTGSRELYIGEVIHKSFVSVDEAGTEAAAATAVVMKLLAAPVAPTEVIVDRPFIFLIRDIQTGAILFVGRILNPGL